MDPTSRLRIATRIHYALLRHLGTGIDVGYMLKREDYAREVRSEEHTSELQSLRTISYAVFCLKKKT